MESEVNEIADSEEIASPISVRAGRFELVVDQKCPHSNKLQDLEGFGKATVNKLISRGITNKKELLYMFPRSYRKTYKWFSGELIQRFRWEYVEFFGEVVSVKRPPPRTRQPIIFSVQNGRSTFDLLWFNMQNASFFNKIAVGTILKIEGKCEYTKRTPQLFHPTIKVVKGNPDGQPCVELVPVYPGFEGISPAKIEQAIETISREFLPYALEIVPEHLLSMHHLPTVVDAFRYLHLLNTNYRRDLSLSRFSDFSIEDAATAMVQFDKQEYSTPGESKFKEQLKIARKRLVFEEFYTLQKRFIADYAESRKNRNALECKDNSEIEAFVKQLPFDLTGDQKSALEVLTRDMKQAVPMRRLLQGDVGSGKTVVAFAAAIHVISNGGQVAMMAPTDVLAKQHMRRAEQFFKNFKLRMALLTGSQPAKLHRETLKRLKNNEIDLLIGTHAIFQEFVEFADEDSADTPDEPLNQPDNNAIFNFEQPRMTEPNNVEELQLSLNLFSTATHQTENIDNTDTLNTLYNKTSDKSSSYTKNLSTHVEVSEKRGSYSGLALVIVDEQHKFGVEQRELLLSKGRDPHLLAMTATPIPRSLAHAFYGDLDLVVIREKPPGRKPIKTYLRDSRARRKMYSYLSEQVHSRAIQLYVVFPLIDYSEKTPDRPNVTDGAAQLANDLMPGCRIGILHGRMSSEQKNAVMERFANHELDVLCSTTVIEVGVDVANASVMVIEGAECFGLSQLHQLRGRVGRGETQSMCVLITSSALSEDTAERLVIFTQTEDGFELAQEDLKMRGPGELLGFRQTGVSEFRFGNILRDEDILEMARRDVTREYFGDVAT